MPNGHSDAIDAEIAYTIEHENDEYEALADFYGHPGLPRESAKFLAHCRDEISKEAYEQDG